MKAYTVYITCTDPGQLAEIERGSPCRRFEVATLHNAVAMVNAARFAAGASMTHGPRKIERNGRWLSETDAFRLEVIRHDA